jgi:hypothetical protein
MGGIVDLYGDERLPLLVQWKSTPEFGPVSDIHLYVGIHIEDLDVSADGRLYAPPDHGPRSADVPSTAAVESYTSNGLTYVRMADNYWRDPTGALSIALLPGTFDGERSVEVSLGAYEVAQGSRGSRFFVRAFAQTAVLNPDACAATPAHVDRGDQPGDPRGPARPDASDQEHAVLSGECIRRYAFTNPIWAITRPLAQCAGTGARAIDSDGDGLPDGCDPCPRSQLNVCAAGRPPGEIVAPTPARQ